MLVFNHQESLQYYTFYIKNENKNSSKLNLKIISILKL